MTCLQKRSSTTPSSYIIQTKRYSIARILTRLPVPTCLCKETLAAIYRTARCHTQEERNPLSHVVTTYTTSLKCTGLFEMIVGVLTTCHTQYTWDRSVCFILFNRATLQVFVTYLTGALYVDPLWFYKHQHDIRVRSRLFVACQRWWFKWRFRFVPSVPGYLREEEEYKPDPWRNPIERNHMGLRLENEVASC